MDPLKSPLGHPGIQKGSFSFQTSQGQGKQINLHRGGQIYPVEYSGYTWCESKGAVYKVGAKIETSSQSTDVQAELPPEWRPNTVHDTMAWHTYGPINAFWFGICAHVLWSSENTPDLRDKCRSFVKHDPRLKNQSQRAVKLGLSTLSDFPDSPRDVTLACSRCNGTQTIPLLGPNSTSCPDCT
jgi:hypothetical protein